MEDRIERATTHLTNVLRDAIKLTPAETALVIFDEQCDLTKDLSEAYRRALPNGQFLNFDQTEPDQVIARVNDMKPGDLVVLVQSTNFRLNEFRFRIEVFQRGLKTIEHTHLKRLSEEQGSLYVEALAYDKEYYHSHGHALKKKLDQAEKVVVECAGTTLVYNSRMEDSKLNIGDYSAMKNVGGTFPIGEVFTEAVDLRNVNGEALVFGFAGDDHIVRIYEPFKVVITDGILSSPEGPADFQKTLALIQEDEEVLVREFGLGLNPAMNKHNLVNDITAFERQKGLHFSLGGKHAMYAKPGLRRKDGRYHVDIFIDAERILINDEVIYKDGEYVRF
jgi:aminopeptidase